MAQDESAKFVARVLEGDRQAFALLIEEYKTPIYNLAYRMTGSVDDAADLTQDIFLRAYVNLWRYNPRKKFFTWIYTIALNHIRNHLKKIKRQNSSNKNDFFFAQKQPGQASFIGQNDIEGFMSRLDNATRALIIMKYHQELSYEEIADITGKSISAIKMRIKRGLQKLQEIYKQSEAIK